MAGGSRHPGTRVSACLSAGAVLLAACTSSKPTASPTRTPPVSPHPARATIRVHVRLVYSHPANGSETRYDGPMTGEEVDASGTAGRGRGTTGLDGWAQLPVRPGSYAVSAPDCGRPKAVDAAPNGSVPVYLLCVAP